MPKNIKTNIPLAPYTTLGIGGPAEFFCTITSYDELRAVAQWAVHEEYPIAVLGGGSNVLVNDEGVRGLVIHNVLTEEVIIEQNTSDVIVRVGAGVLLDDFILRCVECGWWGLENLSAIPGTVGATPVQNVGAYGTEVAQYIVSVTVYNPSTDTELEMDNEACAFGYRDSCFKHAPYNTCIITAVTFKLSLEPQPKLSYKDLMQRFSGTESPTLHEIREVVTAIRAGKFPDWHVLGTAGSFFKNPTISKDKFAALKNTYPDLPGYPTADPNEVKVSLGWILEHVLHKKGYRDGNVALYDKQALVLVNYGSATATDVKKFSDEIIAHVYAELEIVIEREVTTFS